MTDTREHPPAAVPAAKQAGAANVRTNWAWTKSWVWTDRMLTALENGVKGGQWFSLIDKVYREETLYHAARRVTGRKNKAAGVDHVTPAKFEERLLENVRQLSCELQGGTYRPRPVRRTEIPKPGSRETRPLGIPTIRDRVVQTALRDVIEPIFERDFAATNATASVPGYGFRPGRGCKDALRRVDALLKAGYVYVVDADLKSYFDTIPHERLLKLIEQKISDGPARPVCSAAGITGLRLMDEQLPRRNNPPAAVLALIEAFLKQGVMDGLREWTPEEGSPQGAVISPLLSNIYLDPLDHRMDDAGFEMVRYADDRRGRMVSPREVLPTRRSPRRSPRRDHPPVAVILCRTADEADEALARVQQWTAEAGLTLHPEKTRVAHAATDGFAFLGYHFTRGERFPRKKSLQKLKSTLREKTRRTQPHGIDGTIQDVNQTLQGWFAYFRHVTKRSVFEELDRFVRQRLRAILKKQAKRPGIPKGRDFHRWPNAYFGKHGLYSLSAAHVLACQSSMR